MSKILIEEATVKLALEALIAIRKQLKSWGQGDEAIAAEKCKDADDRQEAGRCSAWLMA